MNINDYKNLFLDYLQKNIIVKEPKNLYAPVDYILQLGGKRLRPILALIGTEAFGGNAKQALDAALAIEVFHNFTLLHDDIMDEAPIRRGQPTVHEKWDVNTGILSGDVMLINSYQFLKSYPPNIFKDLSLVFSKTAVEVCEGQQYDMDFVSRNNVTLAEYLKMIEFKTSVLIAAALKMGAIIAEATTLEQEKIYNFGIAAGMAFQLQDDYLDTFGNAQTFGKQIGGDILERKKTWLYLKTLAEASLYDKDILVEIYNKDKEVNDSDIETVKAIFVKYNMDTLIKEKITEFSKNALKQLKKLTLKEKPKMLLEELVLNLNKRNT